MRAFLLFLVSCYVVARDQWIKRASMTTARSDSIAVTVGNAIYLGGGCTGNQTLEGSCPSITNKFESYDPVKDNWTSLPDMPTPRFRHECVAVGNKIYFLFGRDLSDAILNSVDVYNIADQSWSSLPAQTEAQIYSDGAAFVIGTKIYYVGGYNFDYSVSANTTIVLDTTWAVAQFRDGLVPSKTVGSGDNRAISINNKGYVVGGFAVPDFCVPLNTVDVYDSATNSWSSISRYLHPRGDMALTSVQDQIFVVGGESKDKSCNFSVPVDDVEQYDIGALHWIERTAAVRKKFRYDATAYEYTIYHFGGQELPENESEYIVDGDVYSFYILNSWGNVLLPKMALVIGMTFISLLALV